MAEETPLTILQFLRRIISTLPPSPTPPLLPVTNDDAHPITQNLQKLELANLALTLATTAALGLLFSRDFPVSEAHCVVVVGFMAACAAVWNGVLFERMYLKLLGISLVLLCFYVLVWSFLPSRFSWACWIFGAFSLIPSLYLVIINHIFH